MDNNAYGNLETLFENLERFEPLACERCTNNTAYFEKDPYESEVNEQVVIAALCSKCLSDAANEI